MIWAYKAWGSYWSWDPKKVWSLITWLVFALYLHTRIVMDWQGRRLGADRVLGSWPRSSPTLESIILCPDCTAYALRRVDHE